MFDFVMTLASLVRISPFTHISLMAFMTKKSLMSIRLQTESIMKSVKILWRGGSLWISFKEFATIKDRSVGHDGILWCTAQVFVLWRQRFMNFFFVKREYTIETRFVVWCRIKWCSQPLLETKEALDYDNLGGHATLLFWNLCVHGYFLEK